MLKYFYCLIIVVLFIVPAQAQFNLGIGGEVGFPSMFNKEVGQYHHSLASMGAHATVSYIPSQSTFIPSATISVASINLPVQRFNTNNALYMIFSGYSFLLNGRIRKQFDKKEFQYGIGVGVTYLNGSGVGVNGRNGSSFELREYVIDSSEFINMVVPAVNVNAEYIFPISSQIPLYAGIGGQLQYSYFYKQGKEYKLGIIDAQGYYYALQPKLYGHMINPILFLNVYYRFGTKNSSYY